MPIPAKSDGDWDVCQRYCLICLSVVGLVLGASALICVLGVYIFRRRLGVDGIGTNPAIVRAHSPASPFAPVTETRPLARSPHPSSGAVIGGLSALRREVLKRCKVPNPYLGRRLAPGFSAGSFPGYDIRAINMAIVTIVDEMQPRVAEK